ncbi:MAG TPA: enoyl-CoA hydratase-related protein, partial [Longimicrobiales bacterium]|nr:enoyl-CoA hydratase-related protein [Longimicrobiales bacterium]
VDVADHTPDRAPEMLASFHALLLLLLEFPAPTIALVNGAALGGGCELFLACDVAIARSDAKVGLPEIKLGAFPPFAAAVLPRLLGRQRALDLILSGRTLSGADALACGLVQHCVGADAFEDFARQYVNALTASSGPVLRLAKRALLDGQASQVSAALSSCETVYLNQLMQLSDAREGITAFMEKRAPVWQEA